MAKDFENILNNTSDYVSSKVIYKWTRYTEEDIKNTICNTKFLFLKNEDYIVDNETHKISLSMDVIKYMCMTIPTERGKRFREMFKRLQYNYIDDMYDEIAEVM